MPQFAIIIPNLNGKETLGEAMTSALNQVHSDFCVVVCDNASDDGSQEVIEKFKDSRLVTKLFSERLGKTENWQRAYRTVPDAEFLVTLHGDDRLRPTALQHLATAITPKSVLVHGGHRPIRFDGSPIHKREGVSFPFRYSAQRDMFHKLILLGNLVSIVGVAMRTEAFHRLGGWPPEFNFMQDVEMWYRLAQQGTVHYVPHVLGDYRALKVTRPRQQYVYACEMLEWYLSKVDVHAGTALEKYALKGLAHSLKTVPSSRVHGLPEDNQRLELRIQEAERRLAGKTFRVSALQQQRFLRLAQTCLA